MKLTIRERRLRWLWLKRGVVVGLAGAANLVANLAEASSRLCLLEQFKCTNSCIEESKYERRDGSLQWSSASVRRGWRGPGGLKRLVFLLGGLVSASLFLIPRVPLLDGSLGRS
jgi:hypothetical protein